LPGQTGQPSGHLGRGSGVVDDDRAAAGAGQHTFGTTDNVGQIIVVADTDHDEILLGCRLGRGRAAATAVLGNPLAGLFSGPVVHRNLMPGTRQMTRHRYPMTPRPINATLAIVTPEWVFIDLLGRNDSRRSPLFGETGRRHNWRPFTHIRSSAMFSTNQYFDGKVASIAFSQPEGRATVGVMAPGEYEFGTNELEIMHVISGKLTVKLPGSEQWQDFVAGSQFTVPG